MRIPSHEFFGRKVDMHKCVPSNKETQGDTTPYKVFVGGLGDKIDETTLREALSPFGTVTKVSLIRQPDGQWRGRWRR